jgi:hypothetical protein
MKRPRGAAYRRNHHRTLRGLRKWESSHLTDRQLEDLLRSRKKPNGTSLEKLASPSSDCSCPKELRIYDPEMDVEICSIHGVEPCPDQVLVDLVVTGPEKFSRQADNAAVFRHNRGSTTLQPHERGRGIPEKNHLTAISGMYGNRSGSIPSSQKQIRSCPSCHVVQVIDVFGSLLKCQNPACGVKLGNYALIWQPYIPKNPAMNGMDNPAMWFWNDLRRLGAWDPVEDDPAIQSAREFFGKRLNGKISDEDAHRIATVYMKTVSELLTAKRREIKQLLPGILDSCLTVVGVQT